MVERVSKNTGKTFLSGVLLLSFSTVLVKIVGLIYKIPMLTYLGSVGMGYFNSAYEIYALFCVISTAGLPVALSVLVSGALARGESARVRQIYRAAMTVFVAVGLLGTLVMIAFSRRFCTLIRSEHAYGCILAISPTVFFVCVSSALRGYFQGYQRMLPTALSQIIESVGKLVFGLVLARYAIGQGFGTPTVAAFAGVGLTLGTALSFVYLIIEKIRFSPEGEEGEDVRTAEDCGTLQIWRSLARLAIPMTLGASLVSMTKLIDMTMILRRLQSIGYSELLANEAYGSYTTLALSVYGLLPTLVNAIALPLVPMLSAAIAAKDCTRQAQMIRSSYQLTALFAIPASLGLAAYARPILSLLFRSDPEAVEIAAPLLSYLGMSVFLSCMITATNSVLHAYQAVKRPILSMLGGAAVKILSAYLLIGSPKIAMLGAPISTLLCNTAVVLLNLVFAASLCRVPHLGEVFWKPLLAATLATGGSTVLYTFILLPHLGEGILATSIALLLTVLFYLLFAILTGALESELIAMLPMGDRLCRVLQKMRILDYSETAQTIQKRKEI